MSHGGKGDTQRPASVDANTFANNWELAFGKKKESTTMPMPGTIGSAEIVFKDEDNNDSLPNDTTQGG